MAVKKEKKEKASFVDRFIEKIETVGNKLPHPFFLFLYLTVIVVILSFVLSKMGVSVTQVVGARDGGAVEEQTVAVANLLSKEEIQITLTNFVDTFVTYPSLGLMLVMLVGIAFIEQTGFVDALMRKTLLGAPHFLATIALAFVGVNANLTSNAASIFTVTIGASLFKALGRNPFLGVFTGLAAASGGFTANVAIAGTDALLAGITESITIASGIDVAIHPLINYYFTFTATFLLTIVITIVTEKFLAPRIDYEVLEESDGGDLASSELSEIESRGLRNSGIAFIVFFAVILAGTVPQNALLRGEGGQFIPKSPLMDGIVPLLFAFFVTIGTTYGITVKAIETQLDFFKIVRKGLESSLTVVGIIFVSAHFIDLFGRSNLTHILAATGSDFLETMNVGIVPLLMIFMLMVSFVNLFMTSGSSKWLILGPVFIPMLHMMGYSPALAQMTYRIADSATNILSPLSASMAIAMGVLIEYQHPDDNQEIGIGTVIANSLPYSIAIFLVMFLQLLVWLYFDLPLGPGSGIYM